MESESKFILGFRGRLFEVETNFAALELEVGYGAIGSGCAYALGALYSLPDKLNPKTKIRKAIETAAFYSPTVGGKIKYLEL